jgi:hypothetical protein
MSARVRTMIALGYPADPMALRITQRLTAGRAPVEVPIGRWSPLHA